MNDTEMITLVRMIPKTTTQYLPARQREASHQCVDTLIRERHDSQRRTRQHLQEKRRLENRIEDLETQLATANSKIDASELLKRQLIHELYPIVKSMEYQINDLVPTVHYSKLFEMYDLVNKMSCIMAITLRSTNVEQFNNDSLYPFVRQ